MSVPTYSADVYDLARKDIVVRDPFIFADPKRRLYYLHTSKPDERALHVYESPDLEKWRLLGKSFQAPADYWGKRDFWAPDLFLLEGRYYLIITCSTDWTVDTMRGKQPFRGCGVLVSDSPEGPFEPLDNAPITPAEWMCLDGTLFDDGQHLWLIYCHEWVQIGDGTVVAQRISRDLRRLEGEPHVLFKATDAPWQDMSRTDRWVTDGAIINRADDGTLFMTWSSMCQADGSYVIGLATSDSGKVEGPWTHHQTPLNDDDGGHAMLFKTFGGELKISYHSPNRNTPERMILRGFHFENGVAWLD